MRFQGTILYLTKEIWRSSDRISYRAINYFTQDDIFISDKMLNLYLNMSEISRFFGIIIAMYWREHGIPHFHVKYGEFRGVFRIDNLELMEGFLPKRVISLILEWAFQHRQELKNNWDLATDFEELKRIEPLE